MIEGLTAGFRGDVGVYVRHLPTGREVAFRADETFPTASMVKVPNLLPVYRRIHEGELEYDEEIPFPEEVRYPGEDILNGMSEGETMPLGKIIMLSITTSDNTAALWIQELAGGGGEVNRWLEEHGFDSTRVNSRVPGREAHRETWGWGQTTPREMSELLVRIRNEEVVSPGASQGLYRALTSIYWTGEALSGIPPWVQVASKQGAVSHSRSETLLVNAPSGDYVLTIITRNQEDRSWDADNEGWVLLRAISGAVWNYFEPDFPWRGSPDGGRYQP